MYPLYPLQLQIINKDGTLKDVKELEAEEDKEDTPVSIEELTKKEEEEVDESEYEDVQPEDDEDEEDFGEPGEFDDDEFDDNEFDTEPTDEELEYTEEYGLDGDYEDEYERGEE